MSETQARYKIDKLLEKSNWRLSDDDNGKKNVILESATTKSDRKSMS